MSWSDALRRAVPAGCLGALAACGFTPVYGPGGGGLVDPQALRGAIRASDPGTELEFAFLTRFEERLGLPDAPRYDLTYTVATRRSALAIDGSNNITRYNIEGVLNWQMSDETTGAQILAGTETAFTAYSATGSTISTLASERDAQRRLAIILADAVVTRLFAATL